ncbi:DNA 3'-5' helicase [Vibrio crassostreae]|uniref:UvrD-helicase domain-containing protein n=1 Tax=Vibrio crassostreae TaxID=246167 RepID=UPI00104DD516|nr:ATP-dependent helicase [Vibrio crassostreae]TCT63748.1 superfamily I DNA/RNA helicase [Vibrio crassostreae]CAK2015817.1 DNA 3'-5' helicase [Vibrio crassostreae]CAK2075074.1 DNA 3'-5' helicase [Vibrio crassostreae]CAK2086628.1 DNA 3'-5' helicase [Vibrio crassostreae]CAK2144608.1 DNA 3'-5' helicase [Vibrio crassostreae]
MIEDNWLPTEGIEATDQLMNIIKFDESSLSILAGAGSGKTELLAQKSSYLLETNKCNWPKRILCLSFKTEAQVNIGKRVKKRCGSKAERFDSFTFHAFSKSIVDRFMNVLPENERPSKRYDIVMKEYQSNGKNKIWIGSLIKMALRIVTLNTNVKSLFNLSYPYVFIDEFQDTSYEQYNLMRCLFMGSDTKLLCVGDLNQSIMLFANANPTVFDEFQNDFCHANIKRMLLTKNYRATEEIQGVLNKFLEYVEDENNVIQPLTKPSTNCNVKYFPDEFKESSFLVEYIASLVESGIKEEEICVLTKQHSSSYTAVLRSGLSNKGIRNLDMTDLQDTLKEPLGRLFIYILKIYTLKDAKNWSEFCDFCLLLNNICNDEEEEFVNKLSYHVHLNKQLFIDTDPANSLLNLIKTTFKFIGINKIKARWAQYKSLEYFQLIWKNLELHLRYTINVTSSLEEASLMFNAENSVQLMNVHKCKGLEYQSVIFMGMEDEAFWNHTDSNFESKCLTFVALSRAKESILVTLAGDREHRGSQNRYSNFNRVDLLFKTLTGKCGFNYEIHN